MLAPVPISLLLLLTFSLTFCEHCTTEPHPQERGSRPAGILLRASFHVSDPTIGLQILADDRCLIFHAVTWNTSRCVHLQILEGCCLSLMHVLMTCHRGDDSLKMMPCSSQICCRCRRKLGWGVRRPPLPFMSSTMMNNGRSKEETSRMKS